MDFEWDEQKADANVRNHRVRFDFATRVFLDPHLHDVVDPREYGGEVRSNAVGLAGVDLPVVCYTLRQEAIRLISARKANRYEREKYWNRQI